MKVPPAATYRSRIANDVASSVVVPNRIAPRLSTLTVRAANDPVPMIVYRMPSAPGLRALAGRQCSATRGRSICLACTSGRLPGCQLTYLGWRLCQAVGVAGDQNEITAVRCCQTGELEPDSAVRAGGERACGWLIGSHGALLTLPAARRGARQPLTDRSPVPEPCCLAARRPGN